MTLSFNMINPEEIPPDLRPGLYVLEVVDDFTNVESREGHNFKSRILSVRWADPVGRVDNCIAVTAIDVLTEIENRNSITGQLEDTANAEGID